MSKSDRTTAAPEKPSPLGDPGPTGPGPGPDDLKTEQEKGGKDPVTPAQPSPGPVETVEEQGIGPRDPYPSKDGG